MQHIATRITALKEARGLSEARLAEASAISRETLRRRLVDPASFTLAELGRIAEALGTNRRDLMSEDAA